VNIFHGISQTQVAGCEAILTEAERRGLGNPETAYILATVFWETGRAMQPVKEIGQGRGRAYGMADPVTKKIYYGRGLVQLTWKENYAKFAKVCGADLVDHPDLALQLPIALKVVFEGMTEGLFTGKKLGDYLSASIPDYAGARRIVNGTDQANTIASYARQFEVALIAAPVPAAPPASATATQRGIFNRLKSYLGY
jgi:hypothetical protein